jgi:hypothetical protein
MKTDLLAPIRVFQVATGNVGIEMIRRIGRCETIEPGSTSDPEIVMLLATLRWPPLPSLFAPTERPDEPVTAGPVSPRPALRAWKS